MPVAMLAAWAAARAEMHAVELTASLLRRSLRDQARLRGDWGRVEVLRTVDRLRRQSAEILAGAHDEVIQPETLGALADIGARFQAELSGVALARGLAEAVDERFGRRFFGWFEDQGPMARDAGEPVPTTQPALKRLLNRPLASRPESLGLRVRNTEHLALLPDDLQGRTVRLVPKREVLGSLLAPPLRIAVLLPNAGSSELDFDRDPNRERFFGVRPVDVAAQARTILGLLDQAETSGARIALLPELSVPSDLVKEVETWMRQPQRTVRVVVAGSAHVEDGETRMNLATVLGPKGPLLEHRKFNPFEYQGLVEDLDPVEPVITVAANAACMMSTVICKDFLQPGVDELLCSLGLDLLLVPSWSQKTGAFVARALKLTTDTQAIVVVGALADPEPSRPGARGPAVGLASVPTREQSCFQAFRSQTQPPTILCFDVDRPDQAPPWEVAWGEET